MDKNGDETVIHSFGSHPADGDAPSNALMEGADGKLYGTTFRGGEFGGGTLFRVDPSAILPVSSISPTSGTAGGGTSVLIDGAGFEPGATVRIGTVEATVVQGLGGSQLDVTTPALAEGSLNYIFVTNPDGTEGALPRAWFADFGDVPQSDPAHPFVEKIFRAGITAGCGGGSILPLRRSDTSANGGLSPEIAAGREVFPAAGHGRRFFGRERRAASRPRGSRTSRRAASPRDAATGSTVRTSASNGHKWRCSS